MLQAIQQGNISDIVYERLLKQIQDCVWIEGQKIPSEHELCHMLKVSRTTVRNALNRLNAIGVLETRRGEGSYVKTIQGSDYMNAFLPVLKLGSRTLVEVFEYRRIMEVGTVEIAVDRITEAELEELDSLLAKMNDPNLDETLYAEVDVEFHLTISRAAKNTMITAANNFLQDLLQTSMKDIVTMLGRSSGRYYHGLICKYMRQKDKGSVIRTMAEHVEDTEKRILKLIDK